MCAKSDLEPFQHRSMTIWYGIQIHFSEMYTDWYGFRNLYLWNVHCLALLTPKIYILGSTQLSYSCMQTHIYIYIYIYIYIHVGKLVHHLRRDVSFPPCQLRRDGGNYCYAHMLHSDLGISPCTGFPSCWLSQSPGLTATLQICTDFWTSQEDFSTLCD